MLTFLKRIRKSLIDSGSTRKYLLYAIGEIALVVIGILIALQINNWNEWEKDRKEENQMILNLHEEFTQSGTLLTEFIDKYKLKFEACEQLLRLCNENDHRLKQVNVDSLMAMALNYENFILSDGTIQDILNSNKIRLIRSDKLRAMIHDWIKAVKSKDEAYSTLDQFATIQIFPYLTEHISIKNIDQYDQLRWEEASHFEIDNRSVFQNLEFENHINNQAWGLKNFINELYKLKEVLSSIIAETEINEYLKG